MTQEQEDLPISRQKRQPTLPARSGDVAGANVGPGSQAEQEAP